MGHGPAYATCIMAIMCACGGLWSGVRRLGRAPCCGHQCYNMWCSMAVGRAVLFHVGQWWEQSSWVCQPLPPASSCCQGVQLPWLHKDRRAQCSRGAPCVCVCVGVCGGGGSGRVGGCGDMLSLTQIWRPGRPWPPPLPISIPPATRPPPATTNITRPPRYGTEQLSRCRVVVVVVEGAAQGAAHWEQLVGGGRGDRNGTGSCIHVVSYCKLCWVRCLAMCGSY